MIRKLTATQREYIIEAREWLVRARPLDDEYLAQRLKQAIAGLEEILTLDELEA